MSRLDTAATIDRLYALNAGIAITDRSVYSNEMAKGELIRLSCNAYLLKRAGHWILWDTGMDDALASEPDGKVIAHGIRGIVVRTLEDQLRDIGITPAEVGTVILSHAHFDHVGNARLFSHAVWYIQRNEFAAMFGADFENYGYSPELYECLRRTAVNLVDGDLDVFGDGSVNIISTPGHTPGHCSLLVRLAEAGAVVLSGDIAHFRANMECCVVPKMNSDIEASRRSMERIAKVVVDESAQLWLNHDVVQTATVVHAPAFYT